MNRRDILKATGATMIVSHLPAFGATTGNWDRAKLDQAAGVMESWIADGRVSGELFEGPWANVGTPDDLFALARELSKGPRPFNA